MSKNELAKETAEHIKNISLGYLETLVEEANEEYKVFLLNEINNLVSYHLLNENCDCWAINKNDLISIIKNT